MSHVPFVPRCYQSGYTDSDVVTKEFKLGETVIRGDLNGDGVVNATNHMVLTNIIMGKE